MSAAHSIAKGHAAPKVTPRQLEVWRGIADAKGMKAIAYDLGVSLATIARHREALYRRIGCNNPISCTRLAIRWGIIREEVLA